MPNPQVNMLLSYTHKFRAFTFHTQLNINNLFNRYVVGIFPSNGTGFSQISSVGATYYGEPRTYIWSNTFTF